MVEKRLRQMRQSGWYRFLWPYSADYNLRFNPIADHKNAVYKTAYYDNGKLNFKDHHYDM